MKTLLLPLLLATATMACSGSVHDASTDASCVTIDASAPPVDAAAPDAQADAGDAAPEHCALRIDSVEPSEIVLPNPGDPAVQFTVRGCGFASGEGVHDVEVSIQSMPFTIVDDGTLVVSLTGLERDVYVTGSPSAIDVIKHQPDQVQAYILLK